jgi:beta-phosphoglucomutase-like phosphatase (HAD superfamily)
VVTARRNRELILDTAGTARLPDARLNDVVAEREARGGQPAPDTFLAAARALDRMPGRTSGRTRPRASMRWRILHAVRTC